jgi:hypothetical protein
VIRVGGPLAILLLAAMTGMAGITGASPARPSKGVTSSSEAGGTHIRVDTRGGPVHLFRPAGYDRRTAGIVVYVHGYYIHVDQAWREHKLARQFTASRRNALFVAPEAPAGPDEKSDWEHLRPKLTATLRRAGVEPPRGPLIVAGHSAAYRTIVPWLAEPSLHNLILVDALYGNEDDFRAWLDKSQNNRMTLVVKGTAKWADPFVRALPDALTVPEIPRQIAQLSRAERGVRVLSLRSQYGHFELVTEGKVLPVLLGRTPLVAVRSVPARR